MVLLGRQIAGVHRLVAIILIGLACWGVESAQPTRPRSAPVPRLESVTVMGRDYVRLGDWARANGFDQRRNRTAEEFRLERGATTVVLQVDSQRIEINGIGALLSFPFAANQGEGLIARLDVESLLQPLLITPPRNERNARIRRIVLDPGHGGRDPGNMRGPGLEKAYTLLLANELKRQLAALGFKVSLTRSNDKFVDPARRPQIAREAGADLFVSLHFNSSPTAKEVRGAEVYCYTPAGAASSNARGQGHEGAAEGNRHDAKNTMLAFQIQKALVKGLGMEDRGMRRARFAVLRGATMPAVLVEGGFMSNATEANRIFDALWRKKLAKSIADGIVAYKNVVER